WDIVYAQHPLIAADGGSGDSVQPIIDVASSAASGSPSPPSIPAGAVELARGLVQSGMASSLDVSWSLPQWTVANGGLIPNGGGLVYPGASGNTRVANQETGTWSMSSAWNIRSALTWE